MLLFVHGSSATDYFIITGHGASGKTMLGEKLSRHFGWPLLPKDVLAEGRPIVHRRSRFVHRII